MKIKLAILEKDQSYLNRIVNVFGTKYADRFQVYSFTDIDVAFSTLESAKIEVLVASDAFEIDVKNLPRRCGFAYFVDSVDIEMFNGQRAICKFQRVDLIYKQILSIYSENAGNISSLRFSGDKCKVILFQPVSGGVGSSSVAAACAMRFATRGKKTLYLNLEKLGTTDVFFNAEGQFDMSDIIFALKSKKTNLAMKLESCVKQTDNGVFFYSQPKIVLDMMELDSEDIIRLISELQLTGAYDYIIVDMGFDISGDSLKVCNMAHNIVWVGDGSEISNNKLFKAFSAINVLEESSDLSILSRIFLCYNKFSNKTGKILGEIGLKNIGGAPRFEHATSLQVLDQLSANSMFDSLM